MAGDNNTAGTASRLPSSMADSLTFASPEEALQSLAAQSESLALGLAQELDGMLAGNTGSSTGGASSGTKSSSGGPLPPLPDSIVKAAAAASASESNAADNNNFDDSDAYLYSTSDGSKLQTALVCSESILSSLTKVASGGSKASTEMRALENERRQVDDEADAIAAALRLRQLASGAADALTGRRYADAVKMVAEFDRIMEATANLGGDDIVAGGESKEGDGDDNEDEADRAEPLPTPLQIAGTHTHSSYTQTRTVLRQSILERYEQTITASNIHSISELTPLLGMLDLADKGVGLYLRYSQAELSKHMSLSKEAEVEGKQRQLDAQLQAQNMGTEARISRAEQRRRDEARESLGKRVTVCTKLAKIYNAAVTHLRHHLPMVTYALGVADGDAALVQLVHLEVEKRAVQLIRDYAQERQLWEYESRAERVASMIEDRYVNGMGVEELLQGAAAGADASAYGPLQMMGISSGEDNPDAARAQLEQNDCGFRAEVGRLADVDAMMDEAALLLQHTESYERFVRHGCDEVNKARKLRLEQKREEERRKKRDEEARRAGGAQSTMFSGDDSEHKDGDEAEPEYKAIEILPPHTQLNEIVSEVGGHYSVLERCLLLASMQRAFLTASFPDDRNYTPLATLSATEARGPQSSGYRALQTSVVEECLYAAQRSTLRAFATGHVGTASAAANFCTDSLGRVLLSVLTRRAELGIDTLKPGEGLLHGQGGMGAAALAAVRDTALRGVGRAKDSTVYDEAAEKALVQQRITMGIARACANLNDMEVAIDYTRRLMDKFMSETQNYPRGHETEQLRMCIKGLDAVIDSFRANSDSTVNVLIEILSPRIRSIVNEAELEGGSREVAQVYGIFERLYTVIHFANSAFFSGDLDKAYTVLSESLSLFTQLDNKKAIAIANNNLGITCLTMYRTLESVGGDSICGMNVDEIIERGTLHFNQAIALGEEALTDINEKEGWSKSYLIFMQQLSNRYFNRAMFFLSVRNSHPQPEEAERLGMKDLTVTRELDIEVADNGGDNLFEDDESARFALVLGRIRGLLILMRLSYPDDWDLEELFEVAIDELSVAKDNPKHAIFRDIAPAGMMQQLDTDLIQFVEVDRDGIIMAARIGIRMLVEDEYVLPDAALKAAETLLHYLNVVEDAGIPIQNPKETRDALRRYIAIFSSSLECPEDEDMQRHLIMKQSNRGDVTMETF